VIELRVSAWTTESIVALVVDAAYAGTELSVAIRRQRSDNLSSLRSGLLLNALLSAASTSGSLRRPVR
jgi:hypothetical protein